MANPTTNFGWVMPAAVNLVTDLPADFDVFGQAVDTDFVGLKGGTTGQVLAKASATDLDFVWSADAAGMTNPMTTTADIIYSSSGSTPARLGIGSAADVLTVDGSGVPTWAAPSGGSATSYTLINTGGTAFSGAGTTLTVSGLSGYNKLFVSIYNASTTAAQPTLTFRLNADTGSNYNSFGGYVYNPASFSTGMVNGSGTLAGTSAPLGYPSGSASSVVNGGIIIDGANSTSVKVFDVSTTGDQASNDAQRMISFRGQYTGTSVISSISFITPSGTWDAGTVYIYGAN
jgi:hypothetical protein